VYVYRNTRTYPRNQVIVQGFAQVETALATLSGTLRDAIGGKYSKKYSRKSRKWKKISKVAVNLIILVLI